MLTPFQTVQKLYLEPPTSYKIVDFLERKNDVPIIYLKCFVKSVVNM